jgi:hypothetical protein
MTRCKLSGRSAPELFGVFVRRPFGPTRRVVPAEEVAEHDVELIGGLHVELMADTRKDDERRRARSAVKLLGDGEGRADVGVSIEQERRDVDADQRVTQIGCSHCSGHRAGALRVEVRDDPAELLYQLEGRVGREQGWQPPCCVLRSGQVRVARDCFEPRGDFLWGSEPAQPV